MLISLCQFHRKTFLKRDTNVQHQRQHMKCLGQWRLILQCVNDTRYLFGGYQLYWRTYCFQLDCMLMFQVKCSSKHWKSSTIKYRMVHKQEHYNINPRRRLSHWVHTSIIWYLGLTIEGFWRNVSVEKIYYNRILKWFF